MRSKIHTSKIEILRLKVTLKKIVCKFPLLKTFITHFHDSSFDFWDRVLCRLDFFQPLRVLGGNLELLILLIPLSECRECSTNPQLFTILRVFGGSQEAINGRAVLTPPGPTLNYQWSITWRVLTTSVRKREILHSNLQPVTIGYQTVGICWTFPSGFLHPFLTVAWFRLGDLTAALGGNWFKGTCILDIAAILSKGVKFYTRRKKS